MHHAQYIPKPSRPSLALSLKERLDLPRDYPAMNLAIVRGFKFDIVASISREASLSDAEILSGLNLPRFITVQRRKHQRFNSAESNRIYALIETIDRCFSR